MSHSLDQFGHHALSCKNGPDVVSRHNRVRDTLFEFCQRACLGAQLEAGSSLGHEARQTHPADVLIPNWELGKPAAIDLCVTSPLNSKTLQVACVTPNSAAMQAEQMGVHPFGCRVLWKLGTRSSTLSLQTCRKISHPTGAAHN